MEFDRRGLELSTSSASAAAEYRWATERLLLGLPGARDGFARAIAIDPECAEAHTGLAFACLFEGDLPGALPALAAAEAACVGGGGGDMAAERARGQLVAVRAMSNWDLVTSRREGRAHLERYPRDDLAREAVGLLLFLLGESAEIADLYDWLAPQQAEGSGDLDWSFAASWSFACHESGRMDESRQLVEQVLAVHPDDALAIHSMTHVDYESGRHGEGVRLLTTYLDHYEPIAFYQRHLRWHMALHFLANGDTRGAQQLWAKGVAPAAVPIALGAVEDGASLLWRWHLYDLGGWDLPWSDLAELAGEIAHMPISPLPSACAAVTLAALGDQQGLRAMLQTADELAAGGLPVPAEMLRVVAQAATASFAGEWEAVADAFGPVRDQFWRIGGSRAQRELFEDALIYGLLRCGRGEEARVILSDRLARRPSERDTQLVASLS
jgi:hypothetical protein